MSCRDLPFTVWHVFMPCPFTFWQQTLHVGTIITPDHAMFVFVPVIREVFTGCRPDDSSWNHRSVTDIWGIGLLCQAQKYALNKQDHSWTKWVLVILTSHTSCEHQTALSDLVSPIRKPWRCRIMFVHCSSSLWVISEGRDRSLFVIISVGQPVLSYMNSGAGASLVEKLLSSDGTTRSHKAQLNNRLFEKPTEATHESITTVRDFGILTSWIKTFYNDVFNPPEASGKCFGWVLWMLWKWFAWQSIVKPALLTWP